MALRVPRPLRGHTSGKALFPNPSQTAPSRGPDIQTSKPGVHSHVNHHRLPATQNTILGQSNVILFRILKFCVFLQQFLGPNLYLKLKKKNVCVLPVCMLVYHVHGCWLRPEEGIRTLGAGVAVLSYHMCSWEVKQGPLKTSQYSGLLSHFSSCSRHFNLNSAFLQVFT